MTLNPRAAAWLYAVIVASSLDGLSFAGSIGDSCTYSAETKCGTESNKAANFPMPLV